jgi:hypothetical protein
MPEVHSDWPKTLEWIEKQAQESLKSRFATADLLAKEAQTTLTVLLAGVGGSAAYAAKIFESTTPGPIAIASAVVCAYLVALCILLVLRCMMFQSFPALSQDPKNLMHPTYSLDAIREEEVKNIGERIAEAKEKNDVRAKRLNGFRIAAALSPVVFVVTAMITPPAGPQKVERAKITCKSAPAASVPGSLTLNCDLVH